MGMATEYDVKTLITKKPGGCGVLDVWVCGCGGGVSRSPGRMEKCRCGSARFVGVSVGGYVGGVR